MPICLPLPEKVEPRELVARGTYYANRIEFQFKGASLAGLTVEWRNDWRSADGTYEVYRGEV